MSNNKAFWVRNAVLVLSSIILFLCTVCLVVAAPAVITTIPIGGGPWESSADTVANRIYVANAYSNTVSVIDGNINSVIATVPVGSFPSMPAVNSKTHQVYVTNHDGNNISVIDGNTNKVVATISVPYGPSGIEVNPSMNLIYVSSLSNVISVIDGISNTIITTITTAPKPTAFIVNPLNNRVYVTHDPGNNNLTVIDGTTNTVISVVPVPGGNGLAGMAIDPDKNRIFIANFQAKNVLVLDTNTYSLLAAIPVDLNPLTVEYNPNTNHIFVTNSRSQSVSVIDSITYKVLYTIPVGVFPGGQALNSNTNRDYIVNTDSNTLSVIADWAPPTITKAFGATIIPINNTTTLTFSIGNPNPLDSLSGVTFTDDLPDGLIVANNLPVNTCGGTLTAISGSGLIKLEHGTLSGGKNCTVKVDVKGITLGNKSNTTGPISSDEGGIGKPSNTAVLTITSSGPSSQLRFAQLAPATGNVDIYINRKLILQNVSYGTVTPYMPYKPGNYAIDIVKAGDNLNNAEALISEAVDLWNKEVYTYSVLNFNDDPSANSYFYRDIFKTPIEGKAKIKVLHASPDAGALDIAVQGGKVLFHDLNDGESSEYLQIPPGDYNLEIREAGTNHVLCTIPAFSLQAGKLYTVIAEGLINGMPNLTLKLVMDM